MFAFIKMQNEYYLTHGFPCINGFNARDGWLEHECVNARVKRVQFNWSTLALLTLAPLGGGGGQRAPLWFFANSS